MKTRGNWTVMADSRGALFVVGDAYRLNGTDVKIAGPFDTAEQAFDSLEDMQRRCDEFLRSQLQLPL